MGRCRLHPFAHDGEKSVLEVEIQLELVDFNSRLLCRRKGLVFPLLHTACHKRQTWG